ncbi:MAG: aldehyde ferredoxin oxidoreductase family protein [Candidatus Thermoplasmatota archaeon]|nr:aldehyde ferredoxin oxidoreductase family protein [Candidatus Thermoplasmatota archaeon]
MANGYWGKLLSVDLSNKSIKVVPLDMGIAKEYLGGCALAARLAYGKINAGTDPLGPENPLFFMTGPITGTLAPCSGRHGICAKSPLTDIWGEATSGGFWGTALRHAGYDGIIVTGKSDKPVYVSIDNDEFKINDASHLWGKGTYETQSILLKEQEGCRATSIGPAGENMVRFAAVMNDHGRAAARCGLGAVMGSKKLKAITVKGNKKSPLERESEFNEYAKYIQKELRESVMTTVLRDYGTPVYTDMGMELGDVPAKYFTENTFPADDLTGMVLKDKYGAKPRACYACPIGCGKQFVLDGTTIDGPEYETVGALGSLNGIYDMKPVAVAGHICNDLGMDTISAGVAVAFANYLYEKGILKPSQTDGIKLKWGDGELVEKLLKMTAERKGLGNLIAEGVSRMAQNLGVDPGLAIAVNKMEFPMHDPRAFYGMAIAYATSPRGACHLHSQFMEVERGTYRDEDLGIIPGEDPEWRFTLLGKAKMIAIHQNLSEILNAALVCTYPFYKSAQLARLVSSATGWDITPQKLNEIGERSFNLKRVMNNSFGVTRKEDHLPKLALEPLAGGGTAGKTPRDDFENALLEYYDERGWDRESGKPKQETLSRLGIA